MVELQTYDPNTIKHRIVPHHLFLGYSSAKLLHTIIV